jgi:hypothetical protein
VFAGRTIGPSSVCETVGPRSSRKFRDELKFEVALDLISGKLSHADVWRKDEADRPRHETKVP